VSLRSVVALLSRSIDRRAQRGATFVEYALLCGLFAGSATAGIEMMQTSSETKLTNVESSIGNLPSYTVVIPERATTTGAPVTTAAPTTTSTTTSTTTTRPLTTTTSTTTTVQPTTTTKAPTKTAWTSKATANGGKKWTSEASVSVYGTDGKLLTGVSVGVQIRVVQEYTTWDGKSEIRTWTTSANIVDGKATFSNSDLTRNTKNAENIVAMRYEVTDVVYYYPSDPKVRWDGGAATVRVEAP
jgi:Flp pilus assembly pilin Flp